MKNILKRIVIDALKEFYMLTTMVIAIALVCTIIYTGLIGISVILGYITTFILPDSLIPNAILNSSNWVDFGGMGLVTIVALVFLSLIIFGIYQFILYVKKVIQEEKDNN